MQGIIRKKVWFRISQGQDITLTELSKMIRQIQEANPDHDVFFDGDEYAICSVDMKEVAEMEQKKKRSIQKTLLDAL